jgi:hypothetical protein
LICQSQRALVYILQLTLSKKSRRLKKMEGQWQKYKNVLVDKTAVSKMVLVKVPHSLGEFSAFKSGSAVLSQCILKSLLQLFFLYKYHNKSPVKNAT